MLGTITVFLGARAGYVNRNIVYETQMALVTGNQLKAARALAGVDQQHVADAAGVNVNTIRNMEARGAELITSGAVTVRSVQLALEALGIEFLNHTRPGVRLSNPSKPITEAAAAQRLQGTAKAFRRKTAKPTERKR
jgi:transcriptional regulator with XRE-family HTH domain